MRDYSDLGYRPFSQDVASRSSVLSKVMGLLTFAFLFTGAGVIVGAGLGPGSFLVSLIGVFATLFILIAVRERSPINLVLLYAFSTFEGMFLGPVLDTFLVRGLGNIVLDAATATAAVTLLAGIYGATTKRDVSGLSGILFVGLLGIIVASLVGMFLHLPGLYLIISIVTVVIFTGYIVYDLNRITRARGVSEGDAIMFTVSVYLDIFNIFIALLNIFSMLQGNSRD